MKLPIIVDDHGDISLFQSAEDACAYLEPVDVKNNEYVAYDAAGMVLELRVGAREGRALFGLINVSREYVFIKPSEPHRNHREQLERALRCFLVKLDVPQRELQHVSLEGLLSRVQKLISA